MKGLCTHSLGGIGIVYPPDREAGSENWERERERVFINHTLALSPSPSSPPLPPFCLYQPPSLSAEGNAWWLLWSYLCRVKFLARSNASGPRPSERRAGIIKQLSVFFTFYTSSPLLAVSICLAFFFSPFVPCPASWMLHHHPCTVLSLCHGGLPLSPGASPLLTRLYLSLDGFSRLDVYSLQRYFQQCITSNQ